MAISASANAGVVTVLASSTFDASAEGWTAIGDVSSFNHQAAGGNPGGHISVLDAAAGPTIYFQAPSAYLGDFSAAFAGALSFDLQTSAGSLFSNDDVLLTGGGVTLALDIANPSQGSWSSYSVALDDSANWRVGSINGVAATNTQIQTVLGSVSALLIRAEYIVGADTGRLDNVEIVGEVPAPAGAVLMLSGLAVAAGARRLRK